MDNSHNERDEMDARILLGWILEQIEIVQAYPTKKFVVLPAFGLKGPRSLVLRMLHAMAISVQYVLGLEPGGQDVYSQHCYKELASRVANIKQQIVEEEKFRSDYSPDQSEDDRHLF